MAKKMNGINSEQKVKNLSVNGTIIETNEEKAEIFAQTFSDIIVAIKITLHNFYYAKKISRKSKRTF